MFEKTLVEISKDDIEQLVEQEQMESVRLDYKRDRPDKWRDVDSNLPSNEKVLETWKCKKEFLKDVSALANARGGRLVYGVAEKSGIASKVLGVSCNNVDALFNELQQLCENNIEPPVRLECAKVNGFERGPVLILQIPSAWNKPHSVSVAGQRYFYKRYDITSREMTMGETRRAFLETAEIEDRIRAFRKERVQKLMNGEAPVPFAQGRRAIFHIIPIGTFARNEYINIDLKDQYGGEWLRSPGVEHHHGDGYNINGRYTFGGTGIQQVELNQAYAYTQLFRNGVIEGGITFHSAPPRMIYPIAIAKPLCQVLRRGWQYGMRSADIEGPFVIAISLTGWKDCELMENWGDLMPQYVVKIQSNMLLIPEVMLKSLEGNPADYLAPLFDFLWQTCGLPKYDEASKAKLKQ